MKTYKRGVSLVIIIAIVLLIATLTTVVVLVVNNSKANVDGTNAGNNTVVGDNTNKGDNTQETNNKNESIELKWEYKDIDSVDFLNNTKVEEIKIQNKYTHKIITTPFDFNIDEIKEKLSKHSIISDNFVLGTSRSEYMNSEHYTDIGYQQMFTYNKSVLGISKSRNFENLGTKNDFEFKLLGNSAKFNNYYMLIIEVNDIQIYDDMQQDLYAMLSDTIGNDIANALIYIRGEEGFDFEDYLKTEGVTYTFNRNIDIYSNKASFSFYVEASPQFFNAVQFYNAGNYKPFYNDIKYPLNKVLSGNVGNEEVLNYTKFADKYMEYGLDNYTATTLNYSVEETLYDNGFGRHIVDISATREKLGLSGALHPRLDVEYIIIEDKDKIHNVNLKIEGGPGHCTHTPPQKSCYEKLWEIAKNQMLTLFKDIDVSNVTYEQFIDGNYRGKTKIMLLGQERDLNVEVLINPGANPYNGMFTLELEAKKIY